jgi:hypothetical protein
MPSDILVNFEENKDDRAAGQQNVESALRKLALAVKNKQA